jgi:hypothetical protein
MPRPLGCHPRCPPQAQRLACLMVAAVCCCWKIKKAGPCARNRPLTWVGDTGIEPVTSSV